MRYQVCLILSQRYSRDLPLWLGVCDELIFYLSHYKWMWLLRGIMASFKFVKQDIPNQSTSHVLLLSNHTRSEAIHNVSAPYYQPRRVPLTSWIASLTWYTHHKLECTKNITKLLTHPSRLGIFQVLLHIHKCVRACVRACRHMCVSLCARNLQYVCNAEDFCSHCKKRSRCLYRTNETGLTDR